MKFFPFFLKLPVPFMSLLALLCGCSASHYQKQADREAYSIISDKAAAVPGMSEDFSAEMQECTVMQGLPEAPPDVYLDGETEDLNGTPLMLNLENALQIAATNSRDYQRRKESVFLQALALTGERNRFQPQLFWNLSGETGYNSNERWTAGAQSRTGADWLLATGTTLSAGLSTTATRFLSGDPRSAARSVFDLTLTQPVLRDSRIAAIEPLTQAERDMIYELRDFVRYQRRFTVGILADYYRVLERRQRVENEIVNYDNLVRIRRRAEALGDAGRLPELQVDRARQNELSARDSLDQARQNYHRALDDFKMALGINPEIKLILDPGELDTLHKMDMAAPPLTMQEGIEKALANRLDLATARQRTQDAERKVKVAQNALKPGLDLVLGTNVRTADNKPVDFAGGTSSSFARLDADLPLERTSERNTYRRRLIEHEQRLRDLRENRDTIVLEITNRWRDFNRAVSSHEIQKRSVELARERVESTEMLFDAGRSSTRDLLDAHEDLLRAQNRLAQSLVDFRIATLELERDMDILIIDDKGKIMEGAGYDGNKE